MSAIGIARTICPTGHKRKDQTRWSISRTATNRRRVRSKAIPPSGRQGTDHTLLVDCTGRSARSSQPDLLDDTAGPAESLPHDVSSSVPFGAASSVWICGGSQIKHEEDVEVVVLLSVSFLAELGGQRRRQGLLDGADLCKQR